MGQKLREGKRVSTSAKTVTPPESRCSFVMNRPIDVQWQWHMYRLSWHVLVYRMPSDWPRNMLFHEMSSDWPEMCNRAMCHLVAVRLEQSGELLSVKLVIGRVTARYVRYRVRYRAIVCYRTIYAIQRCIVMIMMTIAMLAMVMLMLTVVMAMLTMLTMVILAIVAMVGDGDVNDGR